jgi:hypothetical protein
MGKKKDFINEIERLKKSAGRFNRIVIWGFRYRYHTHRYIHLAFYQTLKKLGVKVLWLEDDKKNQKYIQADDLIIGGDMYGRMMPEKLKFEDYNIPLRDDVWYCLYNFKNIFLDRVNKKRLINLDTYRNEAELSNIKLDEITYIDTTKDIITLWQAWGTNIMPWKFKKPIFNRTKLFFWVGSIWNDKFNHGNIQEIAELKKILAEKALKFIHVRFVPDWINIFLIRHSRLAPSIGGRHQVETNYLPCRMFKNISYGQLGFSNMKKFRDLYKDCSVLGENIEELVTNALEIKKQDYLAMVKKQQEITKKHTYIQKMTNIFEAFDYLNK